MFQYVRRNIERPRHHGDGGDGLAFCQRGASGDSFGQDTKVMYALSIMYFGKSKASLW